MKEKKTNSLKQLLKKKEARRIGIVLNVQKKEPTTIRNFIDPSLIRGRSL